MFFFGRPFVFHFHCTDLSVSALAPKHPAPKQHSAKTARRQNNLAPKQLGANRPAPNNRRQNGGAKKYPAPCGWLTFSCHYSGSALTAMLEITRDFGVS